MAYRGTGKISGGSPKMSFKMGPLRKPKFYYYCYYYYYHNILYSWFFTIVLINKELIKTNYLQQKE